MTPKHVLQLFRTVLRELGASSVPEKDQIEKALATLEEVAMALRSMQEGCDPYTQDLANQLVGKQNDQATPS
jgi:hypothetical protein